jgi:hypothetical protein
VFIAEVYIATAGHEELAECFGVSRLRTAVEVQKPWAAI